MAKVINYDDSRVVLEAGPFEVYEAKRAKRAGTTVRLLPQDDRTVQELVAAAHEMAVDKGWWDDANLGDFMTVRERIEKLALIGCEVAEAIEAVRDGEFQIVEGPDGKPDGLPIELADIAIRLFDLAGALRIDLGDAIRRKMRFNEIRPRRHGGKLA